MGLCYGGSKGGLMALHYKPPAEAAVVQNRHLCSAGATVGLCAACTACSFPAAGAPDLPAA
jgi:CBS-domain-containing membrane protein